jgi:hypothetical protein
MALDEQNAVSASVGAQEVFRLALHNIPPPSDRLLEQAILETMRADETCRIYAAMKLKPANFFEKEHRRAFRDLTLGLPAPAEAVPDETFVERCKKLRWLHAWRHARRLAWEIVRQAYSEPTPDRWCEWAVDQLARLDEGLRKAGLI